MNNNKVRNKAKNKNKNKGGNGGRRKRNTIFTGVQLGGVNAIGNAYSGLKRYPMVDGDTVVTTVRLSKTSTSAVSPAAAEFGGLIVLGRGTDAAGYTFLNNLSIAFEGLSKAYTRFMVLSIKVNARSIGGSTNAIGAISYIASNSTVQNPPTNLQEATQAVHATQHAFGAPGYLHVKPMDYFGDWRFCVDSDDSDAQAGLLQHFNICSTNGALMALYDIELVVAFCGLAL